MKYLLKLTNTNKPEFLAYECADGPISKEEMISDAVYFNEQTWNLVEENKDIRCWVDEDAEKMDMPVLMTLTRNGEIFDVIRGYVLFTKEGKDGQYPLSEEEVKTVVNSKMLSGLKAKITYIEDVKLHANA